MSSRSVAQILWVVFLAAVFVYVAVAYGVSVEPSALPVDALMMALWVVCAVLLVSAVLIHRRLLSPDLARKYSSEPLMKRGISLETLEGRRFFRQSLEQWVLKVNVISWAIAEAVALLGLTAALISARPRAILPFAVAAALLLLRLRPNFTIVDTLAPPSDPHS